MSFRQCIFLATGLLLGSLLGLQAALSDKDKPPKRDDLVRQAVTDLVKIQEKDGMWAYEGVDRVKGEIPVGYRIGGTACVADTPLFAPPDHKDANRAVRAGVACIPKEVDRPLRAGSAESGVMRGNEKANANELPGSAARSAVCETTLVLLNAGSTDAIQAALDAFYKHWDELEKRRKQKGTHEGPYRIAPYYFYYGHRYAAQAIEMLPEKSRAKERDRWLEVILKTRDEDGTWNDPVFDRSKNNATA